MDNSYTARPPIAGSDPLKLFSEWFAEAEKSEPNDPNAMSLATLNGEGRLSVRIVLLKGVDANGFCFFTNSLSHKGQQLKSRPYAALCFHWKSLRRQVRIEGAVEMVSTEEADAYFKTRPRGSQIGAWASLQSETLDARETLEVRVQKFEKEYANKEVPRPPHWCGYRVIPEMIEFWQDMPFRLHDRLVFTVDGKSGWKSERQYP
jgi:pyridoxamine 5'-phosphate oxidase